MRRPYDERTILASAAMASVVLVGFAAVFGSRPDMASVSVRLACAAGFLTGPLAVSYAFRNDGRARLMLSVSSLLVTTAVFVLSPWAKAGPGAWTGTMLVAAMTAAAAQVAVLLGLRRGIAEHVADVNDDSEG